jgi:hypothetical protein
MLLIQKQMEALLQYEEKLVAHKWNVHFICSPNFYMEDVAQLVRALDCGSRGRGFEPHLPPFKRKALIYQGFFFICK